MATSTLWCAGCGASPPDIVAEPYPFRCARAAELPDTDHVITRTLDPSSVRIAADGGSNPFLRYRYFLHPYHTARDLGLTDAAYVELVARLDGAVAGVVGHGFAVTPLHRMPDLDATLGIQGPGAVWVKDETGNVAGSHKGRHLQGIMLHLQIVERLGLDKGGRPPLAIASCGNAALAAAVVARAANRALRVFVPASANPAVVDRLRELGAAVEVCPRDAGEPGDPAYRRFQEAIADGALPFCCQGSDNGLTIDGGATIGLEIAEALGGAPDRLFVQVGGGALASASVRAFSDAVACGLSATLPRIHTVQTSGGAPLARAYDRVLRRILESSGLATREMSGRDAGPTGCFGRAEYYEEFATHLRDVRFENVLRDTMQHARTHRSEFMWPWEVEPRSIAHGILDDETYDWAAVVEGMLQTGGYPVIVSEDELRTANAVARATTGIDVDHTGSAGLAGLMQVLGDCPGARRERNAVIFSGRRFSRDAAHDD